MLVVIEVSCFTIFVTFHLWVGNFCTLGTESFLFFGTESFLSLGADCDEEPLDKTGNNIVGNQG